MTGASSRAKPEARPGQKLSRRRLLCYAAATGVGIKLVRTAHAAEPPTAPRQSDLDSLNQWVTERGGRLSALAVDLASGQTLGEVNSGLPLNPASNMKLLTAAVVLDQLGAQKRFRTGLYGAVDGPVVSKLALRGHGDPSLTEASLWRLANVLASMGVKQVEELLVDQSRFDEQFVPPAFEQQPNEWAPFRAPVSAIAVDRNTVTCNVLPQGAGNPARVWFQPAGVVVPDGQVGTSPRGTGQRIQLRLAATADGLRAQLGGQVAEGLPRQRFAKRLDDPRLAPGLVLQHQLTALGVSVKKVALGGQDIQRLISYHSSAPISDLLKELGKNSDNFYAEMLFKSLCETAETTPASSSEATRLTERWLAEHALAHAGTRVVNGSGLFEGNALSAQLLVDVLRYCFSSFRLRADYVSHLAVGGVDGTLKSRFKNVTAPGQLRAKTGTLNKAIALSGYAFRDGTRAPVAFSILVNDIAGQHSAIRHRLDTIVAKLL